MGATVFLDVHQVPEPEWTGPWGTWLEQVEPGCSSSPLQSLRGLTCVPLLPRGEEGGESQGNSGQQALRPLRSMQLAPGDHCAPHCLACPPSFCPLGFSPLLWPPAQMPPSPEAKSILTSSPGHLAPSLLRVALISPILHVPPPALGLLEGRTPVPLLFHSFRTCSLEAPCVGREADSDDC